MTHVSTAILLVGSEAALLEGLSQSLAALGYAPRVAHSMQEAREMAAASPPLIVVAESSLVADSASELLRLPLRPGGARVLFHTPDRRSAVLSPSVQRGVLADLALPLERHRLAALVQSVVERGRTTGRSTKDTPPEELGA